MDSDDKVFVGILLFSVICLLAFASYNGRGCNQDDDLRNTNEFRICVENGGNYIGGNCIKLEKRGEK